MNLKEILNIHKHIKIQDKDRFYNKKVIVKVTFLKTSINEYFRTLTITYFFSNFNNNPLFRNNSKTSYHGKPK